MVRDAFRKRGYVRNETSLDENEALSIYNTIFNDADKVKAAQAKTSSTEAGSKSGDAPK